VPFPLLEVSCTEFLHHYRCFDSKSHYKQTETFSVKSVFSNFEKIFPNLIKSEKIKNSLGVYGKYS